MMQNEIISIKDFWLCGSDALAIGLKILTTRNIGDQPLTYQNPVNSN
jgi:hypothetical protein